MEIKCLEPQVQDSWDLHCSKVAVLEHYYNTGTFYIALYVHVQTLYIYAVIFRLQHKIKNVWFSKAYAFIYLDKKVVSALPWKIQLRLFAVKTRSFLVQHLPNSQQGENSPRFCNYWQAQMMISFNNAQSGCLSKTIHFNSVFAMKHKNLNL